MPKEEWGVKRVCPTTGKRFYDMGRTPIVSPYTGETVVVETGTKARVLVADKPDPAAKKAPAAGEDVLLDEDDIEDDVDVDEDDVLEDDDDDSTVSIDDLGDVGEEKDEE